MPTEETDFDWAAFEEQAIERLKKGDAWPLSAQVTRR